MTAQPFPFAALPSVSREEAATSAWMRGAARRFVRPARVAEALAALCEDRVSIGHARTGRFEPSRVARDAVGVLVAPADEPGLSRAVLVEVEGALAATAVSRALRQRAPRVVDGGRDPSPELCGALAAVLLATLRRAHAGAALRVLAAGPAHALARDLAGAHRLVAAASLDVVVGDAAFCARVAVPHAAFAPRTAPLDVEAILSTAAMPVAAPLVIATTLAARSEVAALAPGDVFLPSEATLREERGRLVGPVAVVAGRSERGLAGVLEADGMLRVGSVEAHPWDPRSAMTTDPNATLEVLEDVPVVVRVELGVVELSVREWSALAPGDVVALGRKLGDPAILRVGGVAVARGELVQVDGEYGVRIVSRGDR